MVKLKKERVIESQVEEQLYEPNVSKPVVIVTLLLIGILIIISTL